MVKLGEELNWVSTPFRSDSKLSGKKQVGRPRCLSFWFRGNMNRTGHKKDWMENNGCGGFGVVSD